MHQKGLRINLILNRYRIKGRAGAGGYATVQHCFDTRLKRDVAIKCIQITPRDIARAKTSAQYAKRADAVRPVEAALSPEQRVTLEALANPDVQIDEPSFFSSRQKQVELSAHRRSIVRSNNPYNTDEPVNKIVSYSGSFSENTNGDDTPRNVNDSGPFHSSYSLEDFDESPENDFGGVSFDFSEFANYSNFKGRAALEQYSQTVRPIGLKSDKKSNKRHTPAPEAAISRTIGFSNIEGGIPGQIEGAGQADISAIGDDVNIAGPRALGVLSDPKRDARRAALNSLNMPANSEPTPDVDSDPLAGSLLIPGLEEARTAAHLNDVNIVTVYDCVVEGNMAYVIMEYVEGKTLAKILRELGNDITLDMISNIFASISHALEIAHRAGILHLDIKPENVIVNKEGVVKVTDFGLSTLMDASGHGQTGGGTIGYMPLEQMRQQRLDVRTDVWALASLTYEMLSGKNPFKARSLREAEDAILGAELVIPSLCWESIDPSVDDIMFDALSPDKEGRFASIEEFSNELTPLLGDSKEGKNQLALAVNGATTLFPEEQPEEPKPEMRTYVPFIDKLGVFGSNVLMRVFSTLGIAMIVAIAMINFRVSVTPDIAIAHSATSNFATFGLFGTAPIIAGIILVAFCAFGAIFPRFAMPASYVTLVVMLFYNQAYILGVLLTIVLALWWWFVGRRSDMMCTLVVLQPLAGSFGFSAIVPVVSGALQDIRESVLVNLMVVMSAITFASFGSADIANWDIMNDFIVAVNPDIAGASMTESFMSTMTSPQNWCMLFGWLLGAFVYSLCCRRANHLFDVLGSLFCALIIIGTTIAYPLITSNMSLLTPLVISGAIVSSIVGIVFAILNIPDRVRMAPGEW